MKKSILTIALGIISITIFAQVTWPGLGTDNTFRSGTIILKPLAPTTGNQLNISNTGLYLYQNNNSAQGQYQSNNMNLTHSSIQFGISNPNTTNPMSILTTNSFNLYNPTTNAISITCNQCSNTAPFLVTSTGALNATSLSISGSSNFNGSFSNNTFSIGSLPLQTNGSLGGFPAELNYVHTYLGLNTKRNNSTGVWTLGSDGSHNGGSVILSDLNGRFYFSTIPFNNSATIAQTQTDAQIIQNSNLIIDNTGISVKAAATIGTNMVVNGVVGIGTTNTQGFKLAVNGGILAEEVKVITDVPASDYVFEPDYKLKSLNEIKTYVETHKHLPEVPSAAEFKRDGYKVGQMDDLLLRKVEELTLYVIELQKQIETLKTTKQ